MKKHYIQPTCKVLRMTLPSQLLQQSAGLRAERGNYIYDDWDDDGDIEAGRNNYIFSLWGQDSGDGISGGRQDYSAASW